MPDPDLPVLRLSPARMEEMCEDIPAHPDRLRERYVEELAIPLDKAMTLLHVCDLVSLFLFLLFPRAWGTDWATLV